MRRDGTVGTEDVTTWFQRSEPGRTMSALDLMKQRARDEYADDLNTPHDRLAAVGSRIVPSAPVVRHLRSDGHRAGRIDVATPDPTIQPTIVLF